MHRRSIAPSLSAPRPSPQRGIPTVIILHNPRPEDGSEAPTTVVSAPSELPLPNVTAVLPSWPGTGQRGGFGTMHTKVVVARFTTALRVRGKQPTLLVTHHHPLTAHQPLFTGCCGHLQPRPARLGQALPARMDAGLSLREGRPRARVSCRDARHRPGCEPHAPTQRVTPASNPNSPFVQSSRRTSRRCCAPWARRRPCWPPCSSTWTSPLRACT